MARQKVAVLFGGKSGEHEVSLVSATSIIENIDRDKYQLYLIGITKEGHWRYYDGDTEKIKTGEWEQESKKVVFPGDPSYRGFFLIEDPSKIYQVDAIFPVMHGPYGEDGTVQGLFELAHIPYVGCDVLSSSTGMDKIMAKAIFASAGLPQGKYVGVYRHEIERDWERVIASIENSFPYPVFVKPANMGSSVGISKAKNREELVKALDLAGQYDYKIIVEEFIDGREIECAVLGNFEPKASVLGEILPSNEFYDYYAKYQDGGQSKLLIPAPVSAEKSHEIRELAVKAYKALGCTGLSRVDFFLERNTEKVYLNEVNTMPGFTQISMYPKLWEATGISYSDLIDKLIQLAIERFNEKHGK
ncbi:MAG: D-alanine--D-alanine ligase family protein [Caldicoprobacterales bacterium]|nr:D-alanine--D-alanine ligase [Clostridiales bacterium]